MENIFSGISWFCHFFLNYLNNLNEVKLSIFESYNHGFILKLRPKKGLYFDKSSVYSGI